MIPQSVKSEAKKERIKSLNSIIEQRKIEQAIKTGITANILKNSINNKIKNKIIINLESIEEKVL